MRLRCWDREADHQPKHADQREFDQEQAGQARLGGTQAAHDRTAVEVALQDGEARYRSLVDHAPEAIVVFDAGLGSIVDAKVEDARAAHQDALRWIERARQAGVDPARVRAAERALGLHTIPDAAPLEPAEPLTEAAPEPAPDAPSSHEPNTPRAL